jgi:hypothetical protein
MAARAFVIITSISAAGDGTHNGLVSGTYVLLGDDDAVLNDNNCSAVFGYATDASAMRSALAEAIRDSNNDPAIEVVFVESGG